MSKPVKIVRVTHGYNMFVNDVPVVEIAKDRMSFDRKKAGVGTNPKDENIPEGARPHLFKKRDEVIHLAHMIGRYVLGKGDFLEAYVEPVGFAGLKS